MTPVTKDLPTPALARDDSNHVLDVGASVLLEDLRALVAPPAVKDLVDLLAQLLLVDV